MKIPQTYDTARGKHGTMQRLTDGLSVASVGRAEVRRHVLDSVASYHSGFNMHFMKMARSHV